MRKVLIIGLGKSGIGSAKLLAGKTDLSVYDAKEEQDIDPVIRQELEKLGAKCYFAGEPLESFDTVVVSPAVPMDNPLVSRLRKEGSEIIGELELAYRNCQGEFIGITGTNGKTTTTTLVGEIVKAASLPSFVAGNIGYALSECAQKADEGTLMVTEISSFQLETIRDFHPHVSAVLNLTPDHLDRHKTFEYYIAAKMRICEKQTKADFFIYNDDDEETSKAAAKIENVTKVPFSTKDGCEALALLPNSGYIKSGSICVNRNGKVHTLCEVLDLQIPGKHNLQNALAAACIAVFTDIKDAPIKKTLRNFKGVEHRLELVREKRGVKYINDSKGTNPDASIKAIEAFRGPIILIAGGYDKKLPFDSFIESFNGKVSYLILLGETADQIKECAIKHGFKDENIVKCASLSACVASAAKLAERGDVVLLSPACASWGMFDNYEQRGREFKKLVKDLW